MLRPDIVEMRGSMTLTAAHEMSTPPPTRTPNPNANPYRGRLANGASKAGTDNVFGDEQLDVDLAADKIIFDEFKVWQWVPMFCFSACRFPGPSGSRRDEFFFFVENDLVIFSSIINSFFRRNQFCFLLHRKRCICLVNHDFVYFIVFVFFYANMVSFFTVENGFVCSSKTVFVFFVKICFVLLLKKVPFFHSKSVSCCLNLFFEFSIPTRFRFCIGRFFFVFFSLKRFRSSPTYSCNPTVGCSSPSMRLAERLTALRSLGKQCLPGWRKPNALGPGVVCADAKVYGLVTAVMHDVSNTLTPSTSDRRGSCMTMLTFLSLAARVRHSARAPEVRRGRGGSVGGEARRGTHGGLCSKVSVQPRSTHDQRSFFFSSVFVPLRGLIKV